MKISFIVPLKVNSRLGLNQIYSGGHWSKREKLAKEIHMLTRQAMMAKGIPKRIVGNPVAVTLYYNSRLDIDNHGYLAKMIIDSLKGWIIADDSKQYVSAVHQQFWGGDGILVEVEDHDKDNSILKTGRGCSGNQRSNL